MFYSSSNDLQLAAYCDADQDTCHYSRRSLTGYCIFLGSSLIFWKTKKQKVVSKSSTDAEYRSMSHTTSELVSLVGLLHDFQVFLTLIPITLYCDNVVAQHIAANPVFHDKTNHFKIDCHYVREDVQFGFIQTQHVSSLMQIVDIMTKARESVQHRFLTVKLGMVVNDSIPA